MKKLLVTSLLAGASFTAFSQSVNLSDYGCGSVATEDQLNEITQFVQSNPGLKKTTAGVDTLPLTIHIVGKSDGSGYYSLEHLFTVICQTNEKYKPVGVYFNIKWPIRYINNSTYYEHNNSQGNSMMGTNNVANTLNIYFVGDPNGNCGYYSPVRDAIAIKNSCAEPNSTTLVHELGHLFTLPHTFSGWENGNTPSNPELVTRDPNLGANCSSAGDRFCDTDADYIGSRWNCPYTGTKTDARGDLYTPDGTLYMSYSTDACMTRFSPLQIAKMQDNIATKRTVLISTNQPAENITMSKPVVVYPSDKLYSYNKDVVWNKVPGAEYYFVKVTLNGAFLKKTALTADTFLTMDFSMTDGTTYNVTITPVNGVNTCFTSSISKEYTYSGFNTSVSTVGSVGNATMSLSPNPANTSVKISLDALSVGQYDLSVVNISGQKVHQQTVNYSAGPLSTELSVGNLPNGLYMVRFIGHGTQLIQKMIVQH